MGNGRLLAAALAAAALTACGGEEVGSEARPAAPVEVAISIDERAVRVSPSRVGAGIVTFTIANQSPEPARPALSGPTEAAGPEIPPGGTGALRADLAPGTYDIDAGAAAGVRAGRLEVGPERPSSEGELLLP